MEKPLIPIVNEHDEVIGEKDRHDVDRLHDVYRVSAVWVFNSLGQVLLAQRKLTKQKEPGVWGPSVAGTVETDETYEQNAHKETSEELGLKNPSLQELGKVRVSVPFNFFVMMYQTTVDLPAEEFRIQEEEVERVAWRDLDELKADVDANPNNYVKNMAANIEFLEQNRSSV